MIRLSGYQPGVDMDIEITGRLPGENLSEPMVGTAERREGDQDGPIVAIAPVPLPSAELEDWLEQLESLAIAGDHAAARAALLELTANALAADIADVVDLADDGETPEPDRRPSVNTRS